jgi:hypothetical protein
MSNAAPGVPGGAHALVGEVGDVNLLPIRLVAPLHPVHGRHTARSGTLSQVPG